MLLSQIVKNQKQTFGLIRVSNEEKLFILKFSALKRFKTVWKNTGGVITAHLDYAGHPLCKSSFV